MQANDHTLASSYLRQIAEQIGSMGGDVGDWLARSGLRAEQLDDGELAVSFPVFRQLVLDSVALTGEPAMGLLVGDRLREHTHGILGYAAMNSGTLRQAVELLERFFMLRTTMISIDVEQQGDDFRVRLHERIPLGDIARPVLEAALLAFKNVLDFIARGSYQCRGVAFRFAASADAALARELFRCEVRYGQDWTGMVLPSSAIDVPLRVGDPATFGHAVQICQRELDKLAAQVSLSARVQRLMLEQRTSFPSLQLTARLLCMTPRTLHRRLLEEGSSYKQILEQVRRMLALEYLRAGQLSVQEISYALGYTDVANFRRAFKRWESVPPSARR